VSVTDLMNRPATLVVRSATGPVDEYGNPTYAEVEQPTTCELQQSGSREDLDGSVQVVTWRVFMPADAPAHGWDLLRVDGRELTPNGEAWLVVNPRTGEAHHVEAYMSEVV
jgi:hypothetical protein